MDDQHRQPDPPDDQQDQRHDDAVGANDDSADHHPTDEQTDRDVGEPPTDSPLDSKPSQEDPREGSWHFQLEDPVEVKVAPKRCPSCRAPMDDDQAICVRCGFSKAGERAILERERAAASGAPRATTPSTAATAAEGEDIVIVDVEPISDDGRGGQLVPLVIGGVAALLLLVGYLAGNAGLLRDVAPVLTAGGDEPAREAVRWLDRLGGIARFIIFTAVAWLCATGALWSMHHLHRRPVGDWALAGLRLLAIAVVMQLARFLYLDVPILDWPLQAIGVLAIYYLMALAFFRFDWQEAAHFTGISVVALAVLWFAAHIVAWSM